MLHATTFSIFEPNQDCRRGFIYSNETCADFDECIKESSVKVSDGYISCGTHADCQNTMGGYVCICKPGFKPGLAQGIGL